MLTEGQILNKILKRETIATPSYGDELTPFEITPVNFLSFAKSDLKLNSKRSSVNVLSNAKRAITCQVDTILAAFGYSKKSQKENWNFPKKLSF